MRKLHKSARFLIVAVAMLLSVTVTHHANAAKFSVDGIAYRELNDNTCEVSTSLYSGDVNIPETVIYENKNYTVTAIGYEAFLGNSDLTSVTIPNSVTLIRSRAFYGCDGLKSIAIGNSVNIISEDAFKGCNALERVDISDLSAWCRIDFNSNPNWYAKNLLVNGKAITNLTIPNDITEIKSYAFSYCDKMISVTIPSSVISIDDWAFEDCSALTSVVFEDGASDLTLDLDAFYHCSIAKAYIGRPLDFVGIPNAYLGTLEFGENITSIVCGELPEYTSLQNVIVHSVLPPSIQLWYFAETTCQNATLFVPKSSISDYQNAADWKNFRTIKSLDDYNAAVSNVYTDGDTTFRVSNGVLHIVGDAPVRVIAINGTAIYNGKGDIDINLNKGMYIVVIDNKASKIAVK